MPEPWFTREACLPRMASMGISLADEGPSRALRWSVMGAKELLPLLIVPKPGASVTRIGPAGPPRYNVVICQWLH